MIELGTTYAVPEPHLLYMWCTASNNNQYEYINVTSMRIEPVLNITDKTDTDFEHYYDRIADLYRVAVAIVYTTCHDNDCKTEYTGYLYLELTKEESENHLYSDIKALEGILEYADFFFTV